MAVLPFQPWHYKPSRLQRIAITALGRLHQWVEQTLPSLQLEPIAPWRLTHFDPASLMHWTMEQEADRRALKAHKAYMRALSQGIPINVARTEAQYKQALDKPKKHKREAALLRQAEDQSYFWVCAADRFNIGTQP